MGHVEGIKIIEDALCHPHKPVRLYLKAQPRLMPVRTLKYPPNLGAVLPHGPANLAQPLPDGVDEMSKGERYRLFLQRTEKEVAGLNMTTEDEQVKQLSRTQGPVYVLKDAMHGQNNSAMRKTTAVSRAWRRMANWCANVRRQ